jgi:peroxiredoxin
MGERAEERSDASNNPQQASKSPAAIRTGEAAARSKGAITGSATANGLLWVAGAFFLTGLALLLAYQLIHPRAPVGLGPGQVSNPAKENSPVAAGKLAADFALKDLNGKPVKLSSFRGKVVFLNVWATWCGPCREEMPSIEKLYQQFNKNGDLTILAVSQDTAAADEVARYVAKNGYHFRIVLDPENLVGEAYNVTGVPETFIIDKQGRIVAHHMGAFDWSRSDFRAALKELMDSKAG